MEQTVLVSLIYLLVFGLLTIFNSLFILGLHGASQEPYILAPLNNWLNRQLVKKKTRYKWFNSLKDNLYEAMIGCIECMSSFHSLSFLAIVMPTLGFNLHDIFVLIPILLIYIPVVKTLVDFFDTLLGFMKSVIVKNS